MDAKGVSGSHWLESETFCKVPSKGKAAEVPRERIVQGEILVADIQLFPINNLAALSEVSRMSAAVFLTVIWSNWSAASFGQHQL